MKTYFSFCFIVFIILQSFIKAQPCPLNVAPPGANSVCAGFKATITAFGANSYTWTGSTFTAPVFNQSIAAGPGTYTVTGNTHTCSLIVTIGLQPPLNIQITQSSATTCIASNLPVFSHPVTLMPSGAAAYTLYPSTPSGPIPSAIVVRPVASSCYTVVGETSICSGTAVACVTVVPQFSIAVSPVVSSICEGETIELSVSQVGPNAIGPATAFIYNWSDTDTTLNTYSGKTVIASPSGSTGYTVVVLDANQCLSTTATSSITVNVCTDVLEQEMNRVTFFPNPFHDYLDIKVSDAVLIEITDALGRKVMVMEPGAETMSRVDTYLLLPGIYFIAVTNSALQRSGLKVIKN
jgi:hypothetical protein